METTHCFFFSSGGTKSYQLKKQIVEVITACQNIGLKVICTICDQGSANQSAINSLLKDSSEKGINGFHINNIEVIPLYDVPHIFKGIRNNLLTKDLHYCNDGQQKIAKWDHIMQFYYLDTEEENRICHKLSDSHVLRHKINKMKVKMCTQVFSNKVGSLIDRIAKWGKFEIFLPFCYKIYLFYRSER